ncbi:MAG: serine/threonine-protein kinase, partial [Planctomycetaceae bacterium]
MGQGAMGSIYLAHDNQLDRAVALKVPKFRDEERVDQVLIERFYREARAAATLRHPNICPVYDVGEIDGVRYISMAYIEGESLSSFIVSGKPLSQQHIALQIHKVAMALQEAHDQGIVHRDLKPGNVMIDRRNEPIILDFGLARQVKRPPPADELWPSGSDPDVHGQTAEDSRVTQIGTVLGSPAYMSPEQVNGYVEVGPASDVYSLGVALFELLTGRLPFQGPLRKVLAQILRDPPPNPSEFRNDLDPRLEDITVKMMAKRPHDRFECMRDVALSLVDIARHGPVRRSQVTLNISDEVGFADEDELPASPTRRDAERREKFEAQKLKVTALCDRLEYAAAKAILERMAASRDRRFPEHSRWAAEQLGRVTAHL